jgi:hypothetical protein
VSERRQRGHAERPQPPKVMAPKLLALLANLSMPAACRAHMVAGSSASPARNAGHSERSGLGDAEDRPAPATARAAIAERNGAG